MPKQLPNYLAAVLAQAATLKGKSGVFEMKIEHDDWCDLIKGVGPCNCEPVINAPSKLDDD